MRIAYTLLSLAIAGLVWVAHVEAQEAAPEKPAKPAAKPAKPDSLDDDVLKLLADDPGIDVGKKPAKNDDKAPPVDKKGEEKKADPTAPKIPGLNDKLIRELETDQLPDDEDPLARVGNRMRTVQQRIRETDSSTKTQKVQEDIVADLEEVLKALREKQKQQQQQPSPSSKPQPGERETPSQPKKQPGDGQGPRDENNNPAKDSTKEVGPDKPPVGPLQRVPDLLRDSATWGHLPEHQRQVLIQASKLQFLSEYRQMIEDYYTRLAQPNRE